MRGGLVGDDVDLDAPLEDLGEDLGGVADQADRPRGAAPLGGQGLRDRVVQVRRDRVEVAGPQAPLEALGVDFDDEAHAVVHGDRERLRAAHAAAAGRERERALERAPEPFLGDGRERLVGALEDPLRPDVDPRTGRHLPVHGQSERFEPAELGPVRPIGHEVRVGDEHARGPFVGAHDADGAAALDEQRLVRLERQEGPQDRLEVLAGARGPPGAAVDDQVVGALGHRRVEVVLEHPVGRLRLPGLAVQVRAVWCVHVSAPRLCRHHQRLPRLACSFSKASNRALKLPLPKLSEPCRSMIS